MAALTESYMKEFENSFKVGLVGTVDDEGDPHVSLLSSLMAKDANTMIVGEFIEGLSKRFIQERPKCGFLIMSLDKCFWQGSMDWEYVKTEGEDYVRYNKQPKYRYNTYCGIGKVHYFKLRSLTEKARLDMGGVIANAVKVLIKKGSYKTENGENPLTPWGEKLCSGLGNLKYLCYINKDGYPAIIPVIQAQANGPDRLVLTEKPYAELLALVPDGARVAVFVMNLDMESVLVKGVYKRINKRLSAIDIDRVYNSAPPKQGYVYPRVKNTAVEFDGDLH